MGAKSLSRLKSHFDSIEACFVNHSVSGNMLWVLSSLRVFIINYVLHLFELIRQFIFRTGKVDGENELFAQPKEDSQIDEFREELINFLFPSNEYVDEDDRETEIKISALMESFKDSAKYGIKESGEEETECSVSEENSNEKEEVEEESGDKETENSASEKNREVFMEDKEEKEETVKSALIEGEEIENKEEEEEETGRSALISNKFEYVSGRDIIGFMEEPTTTMTFSFREFFVGPHVSNTEISEHKSEKGKSDREQGFPESHPSPSKSQLEISDLESQKEPVFGAESQKEISELKSEQEKSIGDQSFSEFHPPPNDSETEISALEAECNTVFEEESQKEVSDIKSGEEISIGEQSFPEFYASPNRSEAEISDLKSEKEPDFEEESQQEISEIRSEEEKFIGEQSFPEFHLSPNGPEVEISELKSEHEPFFPEESAQQQSMLSFHFSPIVSEAGMSEAKSEEENEGSVQEQRILHGHSSSDQFSLKSEIFHGRDSSDEDDLDFNDNNSFESDSESEESSSSSGLIWGNTDKTDDLITYEFLSYQKGLEKLEPETLKLVEKLRAIDEFIEFAPEKAEQEDPKKYSEEEDDDDDFEWDDDELVQQMKMEMRNARQGGLSTILEDEAEEEAGEEDSGSPKMAEDLKPLKIEEKLEFKDHIREIQKVHKSYEEKMRKLDILNYQTMHALGLRQLKESSDKPMMLKNLLWSSKDQNKKEKKNKSLSEAVGLVEELEVVYVGQLCLSWEILCWEYKKAIELKRFDREWVRRYNVVAGEFQLFQVLMQRFIENEPFQGPRLHNYVKNRCVIRNLLQVPTIQDDGMKDKNLMIKDEEDTVSSERLAEIIRESMYIFSKFARADKHDINGGNNTFFKLPHQSKPSHLKDPATSHLFTNIQTHLLKKEKRLKDIVRRGNCLVRKFQKQSEHKVQLDLEQMVAQVQLKLISRVLSMSKLRKDQLIWCSDKLNRITFVDTKVRVEPSFLFFPF